MKLGWAVATTCMMAVFAFAIYLTLWGAPALKSRPLPLRDSLGPGPGFFPLWLSIIGFALGAVLLVQTLRRPGRDPDAASLMPDGPALLRIVAVVGLLAVAALTLDPLGFRYTAAGFSILALAALGIRSPLALVLFPLFASVGVFDVFYHQLKVPLPIGPWDGPFELVSGLIGPPLAFVRDAISALFAPLFAR